MRHMNKYTCSKAVDFEVENGIITSCQFIGGCHGNTQGVAALVEFLKKYEEEHI